MTKCFFCNRQFREYKARVWHDGFIHCPLCGAPLFDVRVQDADHWIWECMSEQDKKKYGYYDKLKEVENENND